jgi:hypothetical protein
LDAGDGKSGCFGFGLAFLVFPISKEDFLQGLIYGIFRINTDRTVGALENELNL